MSEVVSTPVAASGPIEAIKASEAPNNEAPNTEAAKPEGTEAAKPTIDRFAPKFAALTKKEKEIKAREKQISELQAQIEQQRKELEERQAKMTTENQSWIERFKKNPMEVMRETGLTYEQLTEIQLNEGNPTPEMQMNRLREEMRSEYQKELEAVKAQLKAREEREKEAEEQKAKEEYERYVGQYKEQMKSVIDADDSLELIRANNAYDLVFDVVKEYYESTGEVLQPLEAAKYVEEELETEAKKIFELKKFKGASAPKAPEPKQTNDEPTLSNNLSAEVPATGKRTLSREESIAEAAKMIRFIK